MHRLRSFVPSANHLFVFEAAARRRSFTAAAEELNVSQPAVSKTIRLLEEAIGLKLFRRERARLELTAEGRRLHEQVQKSFDDLHMTIATLRGRHAKDLVRVSFSAAFVQLWLLPRLSAFKERHPDIALRVQESARDDENLVEEDIDVSARLGYGNWPGLESWLFAPEEIFPVCSPSYLALHGAVTRRLDLAGHTLLHCEERYRARVGWREFLRFHGADPSGLRQDFVFTDTLNALEAAAQGQGVALGWKHLVADLLREGRLVLASDMAMRPGPAIHLVMAAGRSPKPGAMQFRDWLRDQARVEDAVPPDSRQDPGRKALG